ncbi:hypothetical protein ACN9JF_08045 [Pseudoalteromonas lipolytica]|uniref:hypothetical protein n=1 Tax=Pseudoalteromonas lipolytica TaxID=570156 RepID=UPI003BA242E2
MNIEFPHTILESKGNVFCITFSPDGTKLAIGTGSYYGLGEVQIHTLAINNDTNALPTLNPEPFSIALTSDSLHVERKFLSFKATSYSATSLSFTPDSQSLWVATSGPARTAGPIAQYIIAKDKLAIASSFRLPSEAYFYADGFVQSENKLFVCFHQMSGQSEKHIFEIALNSDDVQPLQSNRLLFISGCLITPNRYHNSSLLDFTDLAPTKLPNILNLIRGESNNPLRKLTIAEHTISQTYEVEHKITCLAKQPNCDAFMSGDANGGLRYWCLDGTWQSNVFLEPCEQIAKTLNKLTSERLNKSMIAIQYLDNNQGMLTLDALGNLAYWRGAVSFENLNLSKFGSPRCLSLHSNNTTVAIGFKKTHTSQSAYVILLDITQWVDEATDFIRSSNAPSDKFFYTPTLECNCPPHAVRQLFSSITTSIQNSDVTESIRAIELENTLHQVVKDPHYRHLLLAKSVSELLTQLETDFNATCFWWETSYLHSMCWPIMLSTLKKLDLAAMANEIRRKSID